MRGALLGMLLPLVVGFLMPPAVIAKNAPAVSAKKHVQKKTTAVPKKRHVASKSRVASQKRKRAIRRAASTSVVRAVRPVMSAGDRAGLSQTPDPLHLRSNAALVLDQASSTVLFEKNSGAQLPIASLSKLMTSLVVVEAHQDMEEVLAVTSDDVDRLKNTSSRLPIGARLTRAKMLHIALMSSENRAASALGRHYPGGMPAFVAAMNAKAQSLGMMDTHYVEPTGLSSLNVSSANDLAKLVIAAHAHPIIREYTTETDYEVDTGGPVLQYRNSNRLVANPTWEIGLQKTGYIIEAGRCMVMQAVIEGRAVVMIFLDSKGKYSRSADAGTMRKWLEEVKLPALAQTSSAVQG